MIAHRDIGARLAACPSLGVLYSSFAQVLKGKVEDCGCGDCVEALDAAGRLFGAALLSLAGRTLTEHENKCADFVSQYIPCDLGDTGCSTGSC